VGGHGDFVVDERQGHRDTSLVAGTFGAVVLGGGAARRMGGVDKPGVAVGGLPMRDRVLAAAAGASPLVLVGPPVDVPPGVLVTREDPPGGGPVAATAAGLAALGPPDTGPEFVALLAADLPLLTAGAVRLLTDELVRTAADGVVYLDGVGRRRPLCGVWRTAALRAALDRLAQERGGDLTGAAMHTLLASLTVAELRWTRPGPPPWFDVDTGDDVRRAEEWTR
jgi:molybdopterin-guanine dinucleotide biosynthesis protein A